MIKDENVLLQQWIRTHAIMYNGQINKPGADKIKEDTYWKDTGNCPHMDEVLMHMPETPIEMREYLHKLWKNSSIMDIQFINLLTIAAFKKYAIAEEQETKTANEIDIPAYIYNF